MHLQHHELEYTHELHGEYTILLKKPIAINMLIHRRKSQHSYTNLLLEWCPLLLAFPCTTHSNAFISYQYLVLKRSVVVPWSLVAEPELARIFQQCSIVTHFHSLLLATLKQYTIMAPSLKATSCFIHLHLLEQSILDCGYH